MQDMKTKMIAWTLAGGAVAVTGAGLLLPPAPALAISSLMFGGCALAMALREYMYRPKHRLSPRMLEQLR